ncbi:MAG: divergent polysaccharide deacetylase family protein [Desulfobulbaceae bacterium]|nr:divergent polysaccharide deacetylase family protein [Desulfobulbaceae bacterium]
MKIRQNALLRKAAVPFVLSLATIIFLLLSPFPVLSEAILETDANVAGSTEWSDEIGNRVSPVTGFVFEEPPADTNGKIPLASLPGPDDCLDPPQEEELPRVAIIIDDMGHHQQIGAELLDLDLNLTFSFLPYAPFTSGQEEHARQLGRDILVHMPMEPRDSRWDPGPGTLYLDAPAGSMVRTVEENLARVPHAIGVNNHMGSRFTADRQAMHKMLAVLKRKDLFFVDSVTVPGSVGADEARKMGIRTASRHVFLDNSQTPEDICRQLRRLVAYARKHGAGIAIGHPNRATIDALMLCREVLQQQVRIVGIHELVN